MAWGTWSRGTPVAQEAARTSCAKVITRERDRALQGMKNQMKLLNMDPGAKTRWRLQASSEKGSRITAQAIIYLTPITLRARSHPCAHLRVEDPPPVFRVARHHLGTAA